MPRLLDVLGLPPRAGTGPAGATKAGQPPLARTVSKEEADFQAERAAVAQLTNALRANPQAARIRPQLVEIGTKQGNALHHASKGEWRDAMRDLADARAECVTAKKMADDWAVYATRLATANAKVNACMGVFGGGNVAKAQGLIASAAGKVKASPPNFAGALADFAAVDAALRSELEIFAANKVAKLARLTAMTADVQAFVATDIASARALIATLNAALAVGDWSQVMMSALAADDVLSPALRFAERREKYETQRLITVGNISSIKADPAMQDRTGPIEAMLAQADALASHERLRIEEGIATLVSASNRCDLLKSVAPTIVAYNGERASADAEFAALNKHPAAAEVAAARDAISKLLGQAAADATRGHSAADPTPAWDGALMLVRRARVDIGETTKLADGLGASVAADKAAAATPPQLAAMKKALADLNSSAALAAKAPGADQIAEALQRFHAAADVADQALARRDAKAATAPLARAAKALAEAHAIQALHAQYASSLQAVEGQLKSLQGRPTARVMKAKLDPVVKALAEAKSADAAQAGADAIAALRRATEAAAVAEEADRERSAFDAESRKVGDRILAEGGGSKQSRALMDSLVSATMLANAFRFNEAHGALQRMTIQLDQVKLEAGAKKKPPDPNLKKLAAAMVDEGGAAAVDAMIQAQPDNIDPRVIEALATGRYGVKFTIQGSAPGANEVKAMKRMCEVFSTIPNDIRGNRSIQEVSNVDATGGVVAGYTSATASINVAGRREAAQQKFGANQTAYDPKTRKDVSQLPKNIDPTCKAKDENKEVEFIGFAAAHEVGHGVDDERGFMAQHGKDEAKGGWIDHGGDIEAIAEAVGADIAKKFSASAFNKSAE